MNLKRMFEGDDPIIRSLLHTDFYKYTMMYFVWLLYRDVKVRYAFKNRTTSVHLVKTVDERALREEFDYARTLRLNDLEIDYLRQYSGPVSGRRIFPEEFLDFLKNLQLPEYEIRKGDEQYEILFEDLWPLAILWETIGMTIGNTLHFRTLFRSGVDIPVEQIIQRGEARLLAKTDTLKKYPGVLFSDFATRRANNPMWHERCLQIAMDEIPEQLIGTSNVYFAQKYELNLIGTMAHELFMVVAALMSDTDEGILASQARVLMQWEEVFGPDLLIALTDTFGSEAFFEAMTENQARSWAGLRQDSGIPTEFADSEFAFYKHFGIDPVTKLMVPSDGLTVRTMIDIYGHVAGRMKLSNGWGTNFGNDLGGIFEAISIVIKAVAANGISTVKLSDNLAKATGDPTEIERYKRVFGYVGAQYEPTVY